MFNKNNKIFCISIQRTGTTSTGKFFKDHNYDVQGYNKGLSSKWSRLYFSGNYEAIFKDKSFKNNVVFEDNPWWQGDFYKFLYHRFPKAKFILLQRDANKWFDSMVSHSNGKTLGNTFIHSLNYGRKQDFLDLKLDVNPYEFSELDNLLPLDENYRKHYTEFYNFRNKDVLNFFNANDSSRLITTALEDTNKWNVIADFFGIKISENYDVHVNQSL